MLSLAGSTEALCKLTRYDFSLSRLAKPLHIITSYMGQNVGKQPVRHEQDDQFLPLPGMVLSSSGPALLPSVHSLETRAGVSRRQ